MNKKIYIIVKILIDSINLLCHYKEKNILINEAAEYFSQQYQIKYGEYLNIV